MKESRRPSPRKHSEKRLATLAALRGATRDLLERAGQMDELGRLATEAASGRGRLVFVGGEAGVGKTTLVRHFVRTLGPGVRRLWGACDRLSLPRPLGPLVDMAPALGDEFARLLSLEGPRARVFPALRDVLEGSAHVLVFEDVHWADDATLDLLRYLGRRLATTRTLLVATYRDDEIGSTHPLRVTLGDLATSDAARLKVEALTLDAVGTIAAGSGLRPEDLHRRTGGNPFFVTEVLAAGGTSLPPTLRDAVLARAAHLSVAGRRTLEAAAVLGSRFHPTLLAEVDDADHPTLEECFSSGIVMRDGGLVAFRHDLSREAILEATPPLQAAELHRRALAARRRSSRDPDALAVLAHHAEAAGDREAVLELAPRAARRAAELGSHREAAAQYERALRWAGDLPPSERAGLYESRSYECYLTSQIEEALHARERALAIWREVGDRVKVGESHRWLSRLSWYLGRNAEAERHAREALVELESAAPGPQLAWAYTHYAQFHMLAARAKEAEAWGRRAIALATQLGEREVLCHALNTVGTTCGYQEGDEGALSLLERSLSLALELKRDEHVARAYTNLGVVGISQRRLGAARRHLEAGLRYCAEHDLDWSALNMRAWLAQCEFWLGRYEQAAELADTMLKHPKLPAPSRVQALLVLGRVRTRRGEEGAGEVLDEAWALASAGGDLVRVAPVGAARAEAAWLAGDLTRARAEAQAVLDIASGRSHPWTIGEVSYWLWRAGGSAGPGCGVAEPYALQMHGRPRDAAARWRVIGAPYELAMALADLEDPDALREAHETFERLRATPMADRIGRCLRSRGVRGLARRARSSTRANPSGLTTRELEVLALVAEGLRNAEIAGRLFVSSKTVDHHVSSLLGKIGARSRSEAAGRADGILRAAREA